MLRKLLGISDDGTITYIEPYLRSPWPTLVMVLLIALGIAYAIYMYRKESSLSFRRRLSLAIVRSALYTFVLVLLFEPVVAYEMQTNQRRSLLVMVDTSASMAIKDARRTPKDIEEAAQAMGKLNFGEGIINLSEIDKQSAANATRLDLVKGLMDHPKQNVFKQLAKDYQLQYFSFGDKLDSAKSEDDNVPEALKNATAAAKSTRLGDAIQEAVSRYAGQSISGIVVLTDGASNQGAEPLDIARRMGSQGMPLYMVGMGMSNPPDVRVKGLVVQDKVFVKDIVPVRFQIQNTGYTGQPATVSLLLDNKEVGKRQVALKGGTTFYELTFVPERTADAARLEVAVAPQAGEANVENNRVQKTLKIIDDKIKVLYVEGKPRWEYRYLRRVLMRDHRLDVKFLMTEGDKDLARYSEEYVSEFPEDATKAFNFDLVILGDVPSTYFNSNQFARMEQMVRQWGGSLIMIAGGKNAPGTYANTPIANMLPVKFRNEAWESVDDAVYPTVTDEGFNSALMALDASKEATQSIWSVVHPLYNLPPLDGPKPGAVVLAELSDSRRRRQPYPLISWQRCGEGKTMFVASDYLWRIRLKVGDKYHARFWGQAIQFLTLSKLLGQNKRIQMEIDQTDYQVGQRVQISANVLNEAFDPAVMASYTIFMTKEGQAQPTAVRLEPAANIPGLFQGFVTPDQPGKYKLTVAQADVPNANSLEFNLIASSLEQMEPAMQEDTMRKMAQLSEGRYYAANELPQLKDAISGQQKTAVIRREKELWDLPTALVGILVLLGVEWFFRRKYDLL